MGFNGSYLGPTLRATRGEEVTVDFQNGLDEATTVHWHGMHLPADAAGGPHQVAEPGASWAPGWEIDQPAATLWYHPHPHGDAPRMHPRSTRWRMTRGQWTTYCLAIAAGVTLSADCERRC